MKRVRQSHLSFLILVTLAFVTSCSRPAPRQISRQPPAPTGSQTITVIDTTKPDGVPCKLLDATQLFDLGWRPHLKFRAALEATYAWFLSHEVTEDAYVATAI